MTGDDHLLIHLLPLLVRQLWRLYRALRKWRIRSYEIAGDPV